MYSSITTNLQNKVKAGTFKDQIFNEELDKIGKEKEPIKRKVHFNLESKAKTRLIESKDKRIVHFMFNPGVTATISPFCRKYSKHLDGSLEDFEREEKEKFDGYIQRMVNDEPEENDVNPVVYEDMPYE